MGGGGGGGGGAVSSVIEECISESLRECKLNDEGLNSKV